MRKKLIVAIISTLIGSGCSQPKPPMLKPVIPERPVLPTIHEDDLACLSPDAYRRLLIRQLRLRHYAEQLELIVRGSP